MNLDLDSRFETPTHGTVAVMEKGWKFVRYLASGKEELYNLEPDPAETTDLLARRYKTGSAGAPTVDRAFSNPRLIRSSSNA
jgi:hypothetical protein